MVDPIEYNDALARMQAFLESGDLDGAADYLRALHPADSAEIIAEIEPEQQAAILDRLQTEELADVFEQLDEEDMADVAQHLDTETLADVLDEMEPDMAADLLGELEPGQAAEVLGQMEESEEVATLMTYPPDTAGGIMNAAPPSFRRFWTVREAVRFLREHYGDEDQFFYVYVLDRFGRLIGLVNLRSLILAEPDQTVEEIMDRTVISAAATADQEVVAQILQRYDLVQVPVVDDEQRLVGIVTVDDIVDVIEEEATEDIYKLAQVSPDSEVFSPVRQSVRNRTPWLIVNLGTAFLASGVVSLFEGTISQAAILAAFMPVVAGQGGNAGTQTMTIIVRSLALKEISPREHGMGALARISRRPDQRHRHWRVGGVDGLALAAEPVPGARHRRGHAGQPDRGRPGGRGGAHGARAAACGPGPGVEHLRDDLHRRDGIPAVPGVGNLFLGVSDVIGPIRQRESETGDVRSAGFAGWKARSFRKRSCAFVW